MAHKTFTKTRPTPLKDLQIAVQADQSRRYLILDADSPLPSPAYPFDPPLQQDNPQVRAPSTDGPICTPCYWLQNSLSPPPFVQVDPYVDALNYHWNDLSDGRDDLDQFYRSFTPPLSPPALSPRGEGNEYSSKRSGRTFALVPAQVNGKHVFTHVVVNPQDNISEQDSRSPSISPREDGLPEDMQDILRQLDDLASWVKAASSSRDYSTSSIVHATRLAGRPGTDAGRHSTENLSDGPFLDKGKNRSRSASPPSDCDIRRDLIVCATFESLIGALKYLPNF